MTDKPTVATLGPPTDDTIGTDLDQALSFLGQVGTLLSTTRDLVAAMRQISRLCLDILGDACYFDLTDESGNVARVAWAHRDPVKQAEYDALWPTVKPSPYDKHPAALLLAEGKPIFTRVVDDAWMQRMAASEAHLAYMRREHIRSSMVVPIRLDGTPYGAITLSLTEEPSKHFTQRDLKLAVELGRRVGFAVAYARQQATLLKLNADLDAEVLRRGTTRDRFWSVSNDLMSIAGADGYLKAVNPAWHTVLGYDEATLLSMPYRELGDPGNKQAGDEALSRLARGETLVRHVGPFRHADGSERWLSWTVVPQDGLYYAIGHDVTETREKSAALEEANRQLKGEIEERERVEATLRQMQRLEAVGQLTAGVAHDFNNLLTVITGSIGLMEREASENPVLARRLRNMKVAAERGAKLTSQLLAFSRRQRLAPKVLNVAEELESMRDLLQTTLGGGIQLNVALQNEPALATVDPTQLELVLLNLAINARDATTGGGQLIIRVGQADLGPPSNPNEPGPGQYVYLEVADTGCGMTPDVLEKAFDPFFTTKEVGRGSGLGLSQVLGFAKQSGGGVQIESTSSVGTTIRVYLPRAPSTDEAPVIEERTPGLENRSYRILVVDDEDDVRDVTASVLRELGYDVVQAVSAGAALDWLGANQEIDAAILDYAMPLMNGAELARHLRMRLPQLPVLFLTGFAGASDLQEVDKSFIVLKPFDAAALDRKIQTLLRRDEVQRRD